jgi:RES domain-containing protein
MFLWRISNYATLDGIGGTLQSARWHTVGKPIIYTADHPSTALLEMLANLEFELLPSTFQLLKIKVPDGVTPTRAKPRQGWMSEAKTSRSTGDEWLSRGQSLLLEVPSAILPDVFNTLINPQHPDAHLLRIVSMQRVPLDQRLR